MTIDLGRVTPIYRGDYSASESYELNDIVLYNGNLYWHTLDIPTTGVAPTVTSTWTIAFSGADVREAIEQFAQRAETAADNAEDYMEAAESSASSAGTAQTAAENAQTAAEDAQAAAEAAQGKAEDAQTAAETAAASVSAAAAKIDYIALREEEDRQILFGSVVEAADDTYDELRSAPIHNAITIGQSVYPRMDNTRLGLNAIKGRTSVDNDTLVPCIVSGVEVTGRNMHGGDALRDDLLGYVVGAADVPADKYVWWNTPNGTNKDGCFNLPYKENTQYTFICTMQKHSVAALVAWYLNYTDGTKDSISLPTGTQADEIVTFSFTSAAGKTVKNLGKRSSSSWIAVYYEQTGVFEGVLTAADFEPYALTTLPIPTATLNGVGSAQDELVCVEVAENDYKLVRTRKSSVVDLSTLSWSADGARWKVTGFSNAVAPADNNTPANLLSEKYATVAQASVSSTTNSIGLSATGNLFVNTGSTTAGNEPTGNMVYQLVTPTQATIAEHLTLAEVSILAQNGGIIGIVNSNGDIVQPDLTVDTVISKSAS